MNNVTFQKDDQGVRFMAIFLDELRNIGRKFSVSENPYEWTVTIESNF